MIHRYEHDEITAIWNDENKLRRWVYYEELWFNAIGADSDLVPPDEYKAVRDKWPEESHIPSLMTRWQYWEAKVHHDVEAMVRALSDALPPPGNRWVHYGLTGSDIVDTWLRDSIIDSLSLVQRELNQAVTMIAVLASGDDYVQGYTHGQPAEPVLKSGRAALWIRGLEWSFQRARNEAHRIPIKLGGPVNIPDESLYPAIDEVSNILGAEATLTQSQVIPRYYFYTVMHFVTMIANEIEKIARDWWFLISVNDLEIIRGAPSTSMPHKNNPSELERLWGFAAMVRAHMNALTQVEPTLLERDISHSSVERTAIPDMFHLVAVGLKVLAQVGSRLEYVGKEPPIGTHESFKEHIRAGLSRNDAREAAVEQE